MYLALFLYHPTATKFQDSLDLAADQIAFTCERLANAGATVEEHGFSCIRVLEDNGL